MMSNLVLYHGGVPIDFSIQDIDIYQLGIKKGKLYKNFAGFYMLDYNAIKFAIKYAEADELQNRNVAKIEIEADVNVITVNGMFSIDRLSQEKLKSYIEQGYDLVRGVSFEGIQYVLLNKDKIKSLTVIPAEELKKCYTNEYENKKYNNLYSEFNIKQR